MVFISFLCYSGHFPYQSVPKDPFLLDAFTIMYFKELLIGTEGAMYRVVGVGR